MTPRILILASLAALFANLLISQNSGTAANPSAPHEPGPFENAWTAEPHSPHLSSIAPEIRTQRNSYFDSLIGEPKPLTPQSAVRVGMIQGSSLESSPEIPAVQNPKVVLARFESSIPILTASQRAIYTEVTLTVADILDSNSSITIRPGDIVTLAVPGGSVIKDDGSVLSFLTQPRKLYIGPGRTFLLALSYHPDGNFYIMTKAWDVSSGIAKPNYGSHPRTESITGLTVAQLSSKLRADLKAR